MSFVAAAIVAGVSATGATIGAISANKAKKKAEERERKERSKMDALEKQYMSLDTSNPYLEMENVYEDLTVNQQQAEFQAQQFQQSQANILDSVRGAAGGSGIAAVAQALAQQGSIESQRASASIGQQEAANQARAAQQAGTIQNLERQGEIISRNLERDQVGTALGMAQARTAQERQSAMMAEQAKFAAIQGGIEGITSAGVAGIGAYKF